MKESYRYAETKKAENPRAKADIMSMLDVIPADMLQFFEPKLVAEILGNDKERDAVTDICLTYESQIRENGVNEYQWDYLMNLFLNKKSFVDEQYRFLASVSDYSTFCGYMEFLFYSEAVDEFYTYESPEDIATLTKCMFHIKELYECVVIHQKNYDLRLAREYNQNMPFLEYSNEKYFISMANSVYDFCVLSKQFDEAFWKLLDEAANGKRKLVSLRDIKNPNVSLCVLVLDEEGYINNYYGKIAGRPTEEQMQWIRQYAQALGLQFGYKKRLHPLLKHGFGLCNCCNNLIENTEG